MRSLDQEVESTSTGLKVYRAPQQVPQRVAVVQFRSREDMAAEAALKRGLTGEAVTQVVEELRHTVAKEKGVRSEDLHPADLLALDVVGFTEELTHKIQRGSGRPTNVVSRIGQDGPEADALWKKHGGAVVKRYGLLLLVYPTNQLNAVDEAMLDDQLAGGTLRFQVLQLTADRFTGLKSFAAQARAAKTSLGAIDFTVMAGEGDQKFELFYRGAGDAVWRKKPERLEAVLRAAVVLYPQIHTATLWTTEEMHAKFSHVMDVGDFGSGGL